MPSSLPGPGVPLYGAGPRRRVDGGHDGAMIVVECAFTDHPSRLELRPRHRELLAELKEQGVLVDAGPFPDGSGSICVFSADQARVDEALAADPTSPARASASSPYARWTRSSAREPARGVARRHTSSTSPA